LVIDYTPRSKNRHPCYYTPPVGGYFLPKRAIRCDTLAKRFIDKPVGGRQGSGLASHSQPQPRLRSVPRRRRSANEIHTRSSDQQRSPTRLGTSRRRDAEQPLHHPSSRAMPTAKAGNYRRRAGLPRCRVRRLPLTSSLELE